MGMPQTIQMANLGMADSLILMVMALVVFGPRRLPQIGRQIGKLMYEFRKASNDFKFQMEEELRTSEEADRRKKEEERLRTLALTTPAQPALAGLTCGMVPSTSMPCAPKCDMATDRMGANCPTHHDSTGAGCLQDCCRNGWPALESNTRKKRSPS